MSTAIESTHFMPMPRTTMPTNSKHTHPLSLLGYVRMSESIRTRSRIQFVETSSNLNSCPTQNQVPFSSFLYDARYLIKTLTYRRMFISLSKSCLRTTTYRRTIRRSTPDSLLIWTLPITNEQTIYFSIMKIRFRYAPSVCRIHTDLKGSTLGREAKANENRQEGFRYPQRGSESLGLPPSTQVWSHASVDPSMPHSWPALGIMDYSFLSGIC
jgi:hypothetical protein